MMFEGSNQIESSVETTEKDSEVVKRQKIQDRRSNWTIRNWVQLGVFVLTIAVGIQFFVYILQASGSGAITVQRPPGVEGFLPIGALMGWKLFVISGIWDATHPAAMVILGFAGLISLVLRKSFCGWFCPVGSLSEWLWKLGRRIFGKNYRLPLWLDYPLRSAKYLLLGFFVWIIFNMSQQAIHIFLQNAYYKVSDVKMLFFFTRMSALTAAVLLLLVVASLFIRNFWCRYLCPYGALMGLLALLSPTRIQRNAETCIECRRCSRECPYHLPVDVKDRILSPECSGCMVCAQVCPVKDTIKLKTIGLGGITWSAARVGVLIICLFAALVYTARITGHWQSRVSQQEFRILLKNIDSPQITHPRTRFK
jgi:polyferredoxin